MHKPFDLEAAKRGETVELYSEMGVWLPIHFVGTSRHGLPVLQLGGEFHPMAYADKTILRMAAKKVTVRYRVAIVRHFTRELGVSHIRDVAFEKQMESDGCFVQWAADWQEVEIPQ